MITHPDTPHSPPAISGHTPNHTLGGSPDHSHSFGFAAIDAATRQERVNAVFDRVASRYDLMNDLMSGGLHRLWKRAFVQRLRPRPHERLLDLAGGTGDIALRLSRTATTHPVTVCDINPAMLAAGRRRALDQGLLSDQLLWTCGNAEALPFPDRHFDAITIAFGLRNVTRIEQALREIHRVLAPGGRFFCLEFSRVAVPGLDRLYDQWSFHVIPRLGAMVAGDAEAYRYLVESIRRFPAQPQLVGLMRTAGFARPHYVNLSGGIVAVHAGIRL
jgi:demethylmenaquinone methyltransferase / 2-methoxy-6-polyprenyl-1,4-benzoquinol methylase